LRRTIRGWPKETQKTKKETLSSSFAFCGHRGSWEG
jgi:hypothetical protein